MKKVFLKRPYPKTERSFEMNQVAIQELRTRKEARMNEQEEGRKELGKKWR